MAGRLTPLGVFVKWILVPLVVGFLGFRFAGPRIGNGLFGRIKEHLPPQIANIPVPDEAGQGEAATNGETAAAAKTTPRRTSEPSVEVSVQKPQTRKRTRPRRSRPKTQSAPSSRVRVYPPGDGG